jgi:endonuclease YncB( thermonuclease family)
MKKIIFLLVLLVSVSLTAQTFTATVTRVKDGDTFVVVDDSKAEHTIRLQGVDCPEKKQPFGVEATAFTTKSILGKTVTVEVVNRDKYYREVAWITYDKKLNLSRELLKVGLAWHYREYDNSRYLRTLENRAKKAKLGLWADENPIYPSIYRNTKK